MGKRSKVSTKARNGILGAATVSGGLNGMLAMALVVWTIITWHDMNCSFEKGHHCSFPVGSDYENETYYMNVKYVIAIIIVVPSFISIVLALMALSTK